MLSSIFSIFIYSQQFPKDPVTCILYRGICVSMTFSFLSALSWFISNQYQCFLMHFSIYHTRESYGVSDHIIWQHYRLWFRLHRLIDCWALTTFHREFLSILTIRLLLLLLFFMREKSDHLTVCSIRYCYLLHADDIFFYMSSRG